VAATSGDELRTDGSATAIAPTRTSAVWTAAVAVTALLLLLAIFVGENTQTAHISFLWWHGRAPTAVLVLLAAVCGAAIVIGAAAARILQLRRHGRGQRGTDRRRPPRRDHDVPAEV
jgi:uncharacterized integral membrane protein